MGSASYSGTYNVAVGYNAMLVATSVTGTTAIGNQALDALTTGDDNTGVGAAALSNATTGYRNACLGYDAGGQITTGHSNISIGYDSADGLTTGSANVCIGTGTNPDNTSTYQILLGHGVTGLGGNSFTFGKDGGSDRVYNVFTSNASWTRVSDERYKENITPNNDCGLAFINDLNPVTFTWKAKADIDNTLPDYNEEESEPEYKEKMYGLIAQEVKEALDKHNITDFGGWDKEESSGIQAISQEMFVHPLIKAVQELSAEVQELKK